MTRTRQSNEVAQPKGGGVTGGATKRFGFPVSAGGGRSSGSGKPELAAMSPEAGCAIAAAPQTASAATPIAAMIRIIALPLYADMLVRRVSIAN